MGKWTFYCRALPAPSHKNGTIATFKRPKEEKTTCKTQKNSNNGRI